MTTDQKAGLTILIILICLIFGCWLITETRGAENTAELYRYIKQGKDDYYHPPVNLAPVIISPVGPDKARFVTDPHGWRKSPNTGCWQDHKGLDISGGYRCEIYAALAGMVYDTGYNGTDGLYVTLIHADGWRTRYCHLSTIYAEDGQRIDQGAVIGRMGHTGKTTGEHLHFEIWQMGSDTNPLGYLPISLDGEGRF